MVLLVALASCRIFRSPYSGQDETDVAMLMVVNHNTLDMTIFNVRQGRRERLGQVTSLSTASFKLHVNRLPANELQLYADPLGATRGTTSEIVRISPGDTVEWTLQSDLGRSHVTIR
jgi:hypothetical protein